MRRWTGFQWATQDETLGTFFARLDARELDHVRRYVRHTERRALRHLAIVLNRLSNGILYPIIALIMLAAFGRAMLGAVLIAGGSVLVAHLIYPHLKGHCARRRPFDCDPSITSLLNTLDIHSFPSGHAMTAAAALLPLSAARPILTLPVLAAIALIGWARIAAGHHYPSDVLAGVLLGSLIASPGIVWLMY